MDQIELRELLAGASSRSKTFFHLNAKSRFSVALEIIRLQTQVLFSNRFLWFLVALFAYAVMLYVINYNLEMHDRFQLDALYLLMLQFPFIALAVFLNMHLIAAEEDNRTLEMMFTMAGSRYKIWLLRIGVLNLLIFILMIITSALIFFTFTDLPILAASASSYCSVAFAGALTLYFAVPFRSSLAAGMLAGSIIFMLIITADAVDRTRYFFFFNPFDVPRQIDPGVWYVWAWQNRLGILVLAGLLTFAALRGMRHRERLLK